MATTTKSELQKISDSVGFWWHSIDLGENVVTPGRKGPKILADELEALRLPDLKGKTVLDIGAFDGYFSFAAERKGAQRVVAFDHYVWSLDLPAHYAYIIECKQKGISPRPNEETEAWQPATLPGRRAYDAAHTALNSRVETIVGDYMLTDPEPGTTYDVVLYLGVLYHMENPMASLKRVEALTKKGGVAVIETHAAFIPGYEHLEMCEFYSEGQMNGDSSNWWGPNIKALVGMCRAVGFSRVDVVMDDAIYWRKHATVGGVRRKFALAAKEQGLGRAVKLIAGHAMRRIPFVSLFLPKQPRYFRAVVHAWK